MAEREGFEPSEGHVQLIRHLSTSIVIRLRIFAHYGRRFEFNPDGDDALANMFRNIQTSTEAMLAHLA